MSYRLRIPEGIRVHIRDLVLKLPPEVLTEWVRRMQAVCENPRLATPLRSAVLPRALSYSFEIAGHIFVYGVDIDHEQHTIDVLDFKHGHVI